MFRLAEANNDGLTGRMRSYDGTVSGAHALYFQLMLQLANTNVGRISGVLRSRPPKLPVIIAVDVMVGD